MKFALDTNCFIDAFNPSTASYESLQKILNAHSKGQVGLYVSLHSLHELEKKSDKALELARILPTLSYWPIGTIGELVGTIGQLEGTFGDISRNQSIQKKLEILAKSGNDLRDRGALIDALHSSMDGFITSDRQLVGSGPAKRIYDRFRVCILKPNHAVEKLMNKGS